MKFESRALGNVLLRRYQALCRPLARRGPDDVDNDDINRCIVSYGDLCEWAGLGRSYAHPSGNFLVEVAQWCQENDLPPLNALAVKGDTRYPGDGYSSAPGCQDWFNDVKHVIACTDYPAQIA
jgi:hypothetical protein